MTMVLQWKMVSVMYVWMINGAGCMCVSLLKIGIEGVSINKNKCVGDRYLILSKEK